MKYNQNSKPLVCMQTQSTCYKGTSKMKVRGILWHSTGANNPRLSRYVQPSDNASDRAEMLELLGVNRNGNDWNHIYRTAGLNAWIGKLADGSIATVQSMPWDYAPWGCGSGFRGSCNNGWIQFEICEDSLDDREYFDAVYKEACELTAYLCKLYGLDPTGTVSYAGINVPVILCHQDSYKLGLGGNHSDVYHWFNRYEKSMEDVRRDVADIMNNTNEEKEEEEMTAAEKAAFDNLKKEVESLKNSIPEKEKIYHYWDELPEWAYDPIKALYDKKYFFGNNPGDLDLSYGTMRTLVVLARALKADGKLEYQINE